MRTSTEVVGVLVVLAAVLALPFLPMESTRRSLTVALIVTVGCGTMAFFRSRKTTR